MILFSASSKKMGVYDIVIELVKAESIHPDVPELLYRVRHCLYGWDLYRVERGSIQIFYLVCSILLRLNIQGFFIKEM